MGANGNHYIPRTLPEVGRDLDEMHKIANNVKFYMNPLAEQNLPWILQINALAKNRGMHTVVNMMVDDRQLDNGNWQSYADRVVAACQQLNGKADAVLVGNEITLHSPLSRTDIKDRVVALMDRCDQVFDGQVSYEEFWYAKEAWYGYTARPIYWMHYENLGDFQANVQEMESRWGKNAIIGEWGEDLLDGGVERDDWWQKEQVQQRWSIIQKTSTPIAYIFTWKEPSWNSFGIVRPDGVHRPLWAVFSGITPSAPPQTPPPQPPPPTSNTLSSFAVSCTLQGSSCTKTSDITDSTCRYVTFSTGAGNVKMTACNKPSGVEVYRNAFPQGSTFSACFDASCINQNTGFVIYNNSAPPVTPPSTPPPSTATIATLGRSCTANGAACQVQSDTTQGVCRTIVFTTARGNIQVQGCDKGSGNIELYRQAAPNDMAFSACLGAGCVTKENGFAKFQVTGVAPQNPGTTVGGVTSLSPTVTPVGAKVADTIEPTGCRYLKFTPSSGNVEARICNKGDHYEMYLLSTPNSANLCVGTNCVGSSSGFKSFT